MATTDMIAGEARPPSQRANLPVYDSARHGSPFVSELHAVHQYRDLLVQLVSRNIKTRYKRSVLGIAWTMINPLLTMVVMSLVFMHLFRGEIDRYPIYILSGIIIWQFFSMSTSAMMSELVWGGSLLNRIYIPRTIFALSALGTALVNVGLALAPLALLMVIFQAPITPVLLIVPVPIIFAAMFALGLGLFLSTLAVRFADVVDMYQIMLTAWMYLTPIFYPISIVPEEYRWLYNLNPIYLCVTIFRAAVQQGQWPDSMMVTGAGLVAVVSLLLGWWTFTRKADEIAYRV